jgi:penicillin-binding protein-related factor A (putative recombinase)
MVKSDPRWTGFKNKKVGEFSELLVEAALKKLGYVLVEKVNTPWVPIRRGGKIVGAFVTKKVSGDFRAVHAGDGKSVLVEVKSKDADTLPWSAFLPHQIDALNAHKAAGGLTFVAWVRKGEVHIFEWPVPGLAPGKSLLYKPT